MVRPVQQKFEWILHIVRRRSFIRHSNILITPWAITGSVSQIFRNHWFRWCDLRMENEVPANQHANVTNIVQRMMLFRDPEGGYAHYLYLGCVFACTVRQAQASIGFPSHARPAFTRPAEKYMSITGSAI